MDLVLIKNFPNGTIAEMAKQTLEEQGIPSIVKGSGGGLGPVVFQGAGGTTQFNGSGVDLYVQEEDVKSAKELLDSIYDGM